MLKRHIISIIIIFFLVLNALGQEHFDITYKIGDSIRSSGAIEKQQCGVISSVKTKKIGSAFVIGKNLIVTASHVLDGMRRPVFRPGNIVSKNYELEVIYRFPDTDITVLRTKTDLPIDPLKLGSFNDINLDSPVILIGFDIPKKRFNWITTTPIYKGVGEIDKSKNQQDFIALVANALPGYSGGPAFNKNGEVIGLIKSAYIHEDIYTAGRNKVTMAISIEPLKKHMNEISNAMDIKKKKLYSYSLSSVQ